MMAIIIQHQNGTVKTVEVVSASRYKNGKRCNPYLEIRFGIAGVYPLDLYTGKLLLKKGQYNWTAMDLVQAWKYWLFLCPGRNELKNEIPPEFRKEVLG